MNKNGFVLSLDFELYWGLRDVYNKKTLHPIMSKTKEVIPTLLKIFEENNIRATWAIVGMLYNSNLESHNTNIPQSTPDYNSDNINPYLEKINENFYNDICQAINEIQLISNSKNQEIGTHTYSHYYCSESGQNQSNFSDDINLSKNLHHKVHDSELFSIVFPRNQINYLDEVKAVGIKVYRGNQKSFIYRYGLSNSEPKVKFYLSRIFRLLDRYINITGKKSYKIKDVQKKNGLVNVPASRFLDTLPYRNDYSIKLVIRNIKKEMTQAAKNGETYHLWMHPHQYGRRSHENFSYLNEIIAHFCHLRETYNFNSYSMADFIES